MSVRVLNETVNSDNENNKDIKFNDYENLIYQNTHINKSEVRDIARKYWNKGVQVRDAIDIINNDKVTESTGTVGGRSMVLAIMVSENYTWVALGNNKTEAGNALVKAWNERQRNMADNGFEPEYYNSYRKLDDWYGIYFASMKPGECEVW